MSAQALEELKDLEITLQSIASGVPASMSESSASGLAQKPSEIISSKRNKHTYQDFLVIEKTELTAYIPTKANDLDAGYDLCAYEEVTVPAWGMALVNTKIKICLPPGTYGRIASRSGLSVKHNLEVGAGVIDRGYTGEIIVVLRNFADHDYKINRGDKVAQLILEQCLQVPIKVVKSVADILNFTTRGTMGFGSSGK